MTSSIVTTLDAPQQSSGTYLAPEDKTVNASTSAAATSGSSASNAGTITSSDFLTLLVTELKNQDPTSNQDPNAYIDQLVQVNSLQQLISINQDLSGSSTSTSTTATGNG